MLNMNGRILTLMTFIIGVSDVFCQVTFDAQTLSKINNHDVEIKELERVVNVLKSAFVMMGNSYTNLTQQYQQLMENNRMLESKLHTISHDCSNLCSTQSTGAITLHTTLGQTPSVLPTLGQTPSVLPTLGQTPSVLPTLGQTPSVLPTLGQTPSVSQTVGQTPSTKAPCVDMTPEATCRLAAAIVCPDYTHAREANCLHHCGYC